MIFSFNTRGVKNLFAQRSILGRAKWKGNAETVDYPQNTQPIVHWQIGFIPASTSKVMLGHFAALTTAATIVQFPIILLRLTNPFLLAYVART